MKKELIFYFDRQEVWRQTNDFCFSSAPMILSSCIVGSYAGEITDAIDGTSMEIEYVRMYNEAIDTTTNEINDSIDESKFVDITARGDEIVIKSATSCKTELFNTKGISVVSKHFEPGENRISMRTKGVYIARLTNSKGVFTKKITIL